MRTDHVMPRFSVERVLPEMNITRVDGLLRRPTNLRTFAEIERSWLLYLEEASEV
jgi:hypothetical protein